MNRVERLVQVFVAIATDIKALISNIGNLSQLTTVSKTDLVTAVNELVSPSDGNTYVRKNTVWVKNNPTELVATNHNVKVDARRLLNIYKAASSNSIESGYGNFHESDVGKKVRIYNRTTSTYVGSSTVSEVVSATQILIADSLVSPVQITDDCICWIGTNNQVALQAVLDLAGSMADALTSTADIALQRSKGLVTVSIPTTEYGSGCLISSAITIPRGVIIDASAVIVSDCGYSDLSNRDWSVFVSSGGTIKRLSVDAMWGMGVSAGLAGEYSRSTISNLDVHNVGTDYNVGLGLTSHVGFQVSGLDWTLENVRITQGRIGLSIQNAAYISISNATLVRTVNSVQLNGVQQLHASNIMLNTTSGYGVSIDGSSNVVLSVQAITDSDNFPLGLMTYGALVGENSTEYNRNKNINIDFTAQSTGGTAVKISNTADSRFRCNLSNERLSFNSIVHHPITVGIQYGTGNYGYMISEINVSRSANSGSDINSLINPHAGIRYGTISINDRDIDSTPITVSAIEPASPTPNQLWLDIS